MNQLELNIWEPLPHRTVRRLDYVCQMFTDQEAAKDFRIEAEHILINGGDGPYWNDEHTMAYFRHPNGDLFDAYIVEIK